MVAITKEFTILAVHGDVVEANVQSILDEKSARKDSGISQNDWPKAKCNGLIVAETIGDGEPSRIEVHVYDFAEMEGFAQNGKIKVTIEIA